MLDPFASSLLQHLISYCSFLTGPEVPTFPSKVVLLVLQEVSKPGLGWCRTHIHCCVWAEGRACPRLIGRMTAPYIT